MRGVKEGVQVSHHMLHPPLCVGQANSIKLSVRVCCYPYVQLSLS